MLMQILDVDYFTGANKPVVRIFGRNEKGQSVCALYDQLLPYFYVECPDEKVDEIKKIAQVKLVEDVQMFLPIGYSSEKSILRKITLTNPQDVPDIRDKLFAMSVRNIYEADILFKYRFMVDMGLYGMQWINAEGKGASTKVSKVPTIAAQKIEAVARSENMKIKILSFDIECVSGDMKRLPEAKRDPIAMISLAFSEEHRGKKDLVLVGRNFSGENSKGFPNEKEMLEEFIKVIEEYDPDVITGYNINNFDLPYVLDRLKANKLSLSSMGRSDKPMFGRNMGMNFEFTIPGRVVFDPYQILKRDPWLKFHKYDLNTVAMKMLGEQKLDVEYSEMLTLWNGKREDLARFVEYARKDADLALRLVTEKGLLDKFFELSKISGLLLQDVLGGQTRRVDTMLLHEFKKKGFVMPLSPSKSDLIRRNKERDKEGLKGATVLEPLKGLHADGCVLVLDFKSLYPSIMRTFNISPDTLLMGREDLDHQTSPTGAKFVTAEVREGILPRLLTDLIDMRGKIKKEMKTASGEAKRILNAKQLAIKDMSNSFYGYTGYVRARLYTIDVAASITAYGRINIEKTKDLVGNKFGLVVVYGDTDSIFLKAKTIDLDEAKKLGEEVSKYITDNLPGYLELQFEKIYRTFLILTKKRYAGLRYDFAGGKWTSEIEMRGIETVRRDWCPLVSEVMNKVLDMLLKEGDLEKAIKLVKEVLEKLRKNEVELEKLTIVKGITKSVDSYEGLQPHIELARKMAARNPQDAPRVGDRLGFVIIKGNALLSRRSEDPKYARKHSLEIDSDYYIQSQLLPPIERIFSAAGIEKSEILGGGRQVSLGDIMNGSKRQMKHDIEVRFEKKKEEETLKGWDEFICKNCKKSYKTLPLKGSCNCGGELLMSFHGLMSSKASAG